MESILSILRACQQEQTDVRLHFRGGQLSGKIVQLTSDAVEIRHDGRRSVVLLSSIDAVTRD